MARNEGFCDSPTQKTYRNAREAKGYNIWRFSGGAAFCSRFRAEIREAAEFWMRRLDPRILSDCVRD